MAATPAAPVQGMPPAPRSPAPAAPTPTVVMNQQGPLPGQPMAAQGVAAQGMQAQPAQPYPAQTPPGYGQQPNMAPYPQQPNQPAQYGQAYPAYPAGSYGPSSSAFFHIWGPFAGYGTRRKHIGWLLDNRGSRAADLINQVRTRFANRQIDGVTISQDTLVARGLLVEMRNYFLLRKKLATVGLYINNFGKDLFISIVTYLKPPISNVRVVLLALMVIFWMYMTFIFPAALNDAFTGLLGASTSFFGGRSDGGEGLATLLCVVGPVGMLNSLALGIFVLYSLYKFITEKDILAGLRTTPNEFNEDDLMAMEKAAEQTVRMAMDDIGLDPVNLKQVMPNQPARLF